MESDKRKKALENWLQLIQCPYHALEALPGDASLRRYYRLRGSDQSYIVMDAPPLNENCLPYVAIAKALRHQGLLVPDIIEADITQGFLLLTDFGDATYLRSLTASNADHHYELALTALVTLQACPSVPGWSVPSFSADFMWCEWVWHKEWFLTKLLQLTISKEETAALDACYAALVKEAVVQPQVFMHRDYHSANLMMVAHRAVGILDFQDAFIGPLTYDAVSLLRDCYIDWPADRVHDWALRYLQKLQARGCHVEVSAAEFLRWFDWMGVQRHLKALLTFARKYVRDQDARYLVFIPRVLTYLENVTGAYPALAALHDFLRERVKPTLQQVLLCVA